MAAKIDLPAIWDGLKSLGVFGKNAEREIDRSRVLDRAVVAALPDPLTNRSRMIIVTDEAGGEVPAWSDGVDWRRVTDRAIVS